MGAANVLKDVDGAVATLTINRPDKLNALNIATRQSIIDHLRELEDDRDIRVVILTGAGEGLSD